MASKVKNSADRVNRAREIGATVRGERRRAKLSQQSLGELAGTGLNFISQLERGKQTVRLDKLLAVLRVLGLELVALRAKRRPNPEAEKEQ